MNKKINTELALILTLLSAVLAVAVMLAFVDRNRLPKEEGSSVKVINQETVPVEREYHPKVYEQTYSFRRYNMPLLVSLPEGIVGNDYGDGLAQFVIKARTDKNGEIAYDGGFPIVGVRISDRCDELDATLMCSHFLHLANSKDPKKWIVREKNEQPMSVKRANVYAYEEDFYDEYYLKVGNRVVSVSYSLTTNPVYVLEGVEKKELAKLPPFLNEEKQMREFMQQLIEELEKQQL